MVHLRELLTGISGKLAAIGLRIDRRKSGIRVAKATPTLPDTASAMNDAQKSFKTAPAGPS